MKNFIKTSLLSIPLITWTVSAKDISIDEFKDKIAQNLAITECKYNTWKHEIDLSENNPFSIGQNEDAILVAYNVLKIDMKKQWDNYDFFPKDFEINFDIKNKSQLQQNYWVDTLDELAEKSNENKYDINELFLKKTKDCKKVFKKNKKEHTNKKKKWLTKRVFNYLWKKVVDKITE